MEERVEEERGVEGAPAVVGVVRSEQCRNSINTAQSMRNP